MKIAVLAANGKSGSCIVKEAMGRNLHVNAFIRSTCANLPKNIERVKKDIFELTREDLKGYDVVVDAFAEWENLTLHKKHIEHLAKIFKDLGDTRLIVVGGAGSLYVDKEHKTRLLDTPEFPKEYLGVAKATAEVLDFLRTQDFYYTYISPAADYDFNAPKTGKYTLGGDELILNSKGESKISYADLAVMIVELIFKGGNKQKRLTAISEY